MPRSLIVTDDWSGYGSLRTRGYDHHAIAECGDPEVAEEFMPIIHLVYNLKTWINGIHHGVSAKHLQAYLNEFTFRFNRRFYPFNAFRSLLGIAGGVEAPTYSGLYSGEWTHPTSSGCLSYRIGRSNFASGVLAPNNAAEPSANATLGQRCARFPCQLPVMLWCSRSGPCQHHDKQISHQPNHEVNSILNAFRAAIDALFGDPSLGMDAVYRADGTDPGVPVRVIVRRPDRIGTFGETRIATETTMFDIRVSEIAVPAEGDSIEVDGTVHVIQGEPIRDAEGLIWTIEARRG